MITCFMVGLMFQRVMCLEYYSYKQPFSFFSFTNKSKSFSIKQIKQLISFIIYKDILLKMNCLNLNLKEKR